MVDLIIQRHIKPYSPFDRSTVHVEDTAILTVICRSSWDLVGIEARLGKMPPPHSSWSERLAVILCLYLIVLIKCMVYTAHVT